MRTHVKLSTIGALLAGSHPNPGEVLGPHEVVHEGRRALAVRAFLPESQRAWVMHPSHEAPQPMRKIHPAGIYEAICPLASNDQERRYQIRLASPDGAMKTIHDPYAFAPLLTEYDLFLHGEGSHWKAYEKFGAQLRTIDGVPGVNFAVWAPNAQAVSVVGDFNQWDGRRHPLKKHVPSGVWELFVPDLGPGEKYKYRIRTEWGETVEKCDPYGFAAEVPPQTASITADLNAFEWSDQAWMQRRRGEGRAPLWGLVAPTAVPLGTLAYMAYLWRVFGDPLAFVHGAAAWARQPASPLTTMSGLLQTPAAGWGAALLAGQIHLDNWIDLAFVLVFLLLGFVLLYQRRWSEGVFVLLGVLIPFSSGLLMSQRRYVWVLFPVFILLAQWGKRPWIDRLVTAVSLICLALFVVLFANGYWVG